MSALYAISNHITFVH